MHPRLVTAVALLAGVDVQTVRRWQTVGVSELHATRIDAAVMLLREGQLDRALAGLAPELRALMRADSGRVGS